MPVLAPAMPELAPLPPLPIYRFSVDQYHRMADEGVLSAEEPVELLEGLIVVKGQSTSVPAIEVLDVTDEDGLHLPLPIRRFTVRQYHRMIDTGILTEADRVELIEGWIICKMTRNPPHEVCVGLALQALNAKLPPNWHCRVQAAIATDSGEPEPDVAVARGNLRDYLQRHPRPRDLGLAVEVADTSLASDRNLKGPSYARVGIPIYWIVNIPDGVLEVYTDPTGADPEPHYQQRRDYAVTETVPLIFDSQEVARIPVRDLLP